MNTTRPNANTNHLKKSKPFPGKKYLATQTSVPFFGAGNGNFHHEVWIVTKPSKPTSNSRRNSKRWFCKWINKPTLEDNIFLAQKETIAQEFFRLLFPRHPKTRWWVKEDKVYVLCEEIPGFIDFSTERGRSGDNILRDRIFSARKDFAEILVAAIFLDEDDLRNANLGFNANGRIVKIDSGQCYSELYDCEENTPNHAITTADLATLPYAQSYSPHGWPSLYKVPLNPHSRYFHDSVFRLAVNRTILKIIILPNDFIRSFVSCYTDENNTAELLTKIMIERRGMLSRAALDLADFTEYLYSNAVRINFHNYINQLKQFKSMGQYFLWDQLPNLEQELSKKYDDLYSYASPQQLGNTLMSLIENGDFDIALALLRRRPDADLTNWNKPQLINYSFLQLAVMKNWINMDLVLTLCQSSENMGNPNILGQTELTFAMQNHHFAAMKLFLKCAAWKYQWDEIKPALLSLSYQPVREHSSEDLMQRIDLFHYIRLYSTESLTARQRDGALIVKNIINNVTNTDDILAVIDHLEKNERNNAFLTPRHSLSDNFNLSTWKGQDVSSAWEEIITCAKKRILELAKISRTLPPDDKINAFLKTPTNKWTVTFYKTTREMEEYRKIRHTNEAKDTEDGVRLA